MKQMMLAMKKLPVSVAWSVLLISLAVSVVQAKSVRLIAQKTLPAVVMLVMEDANRRPITVGTGFFIREDVIATSLHVIEGATRGYYKHIGLKKKYPVSGIVGIDEKRDLVLLSAPKAKVPPLPLGDSGEAAVGDVIYAIGSPHGLEGTFSQGMISGIREAGSHTFFQITAPLSIGSSGGPILDAQGEVIGMSLSAHKAGQNINFAIPSSYLEELLTDLKPVVPLSAYVPKSKDQQIRGTVAKKSDKDVIGTHFTWDRWSGMRRHYSFSIRNQLQQPVKNIYCLVEFYDRNGDPVHVETERYYDIIPAGLAKRTSGSIDVYISDLVDKVEIRVVSFDRAE